jgi:O-antigen/teichoic acid export membrane protein
VILVKRVNETRRLSRFAAGGRLELPGAARLAHEFFWVGTGQAASVVGSIIGLKVLTSALGAAEFGRLALALTLSSLLGLSVFAGPGAATLRFFSAARESGALETLMRAARRSISQRAIPLTGATVVVCAALLLRGNGRLANVVFASVLQALFTSFTTVLDGAQNAARQRRVVALHSGLSQWLRWIVAIGLFRLYGPSSAVALWGYTAAAAGVFASQLFFFHTLLARSPKAATAPAPNADSVSEWTTRINEYGLPFSLFGLPAWLHASSERWSLERFATAHAVGLYAVVAQLGFGMTTLFSNLVIQLVSPMLYHRAGDGTDNQRMRQVHKLSERLLLGFFLLTVVTSLVVAGLHSWIFRLFVPAEFAVVSYLLPISVFSGGVFACGQLALVSISTGTSSRSLMAPKIGSAAIGLVATVVSAARWGIVGVVFANLLASVVYCGWTVVIAIRKHRQAARTAAVATNAWGSDPQMSSPPASVVT